MRLQIKTNKNYKKKKLQSTNKKKLFTVKTPLKRNRLPQNSHENGIAPVCIRTCSVSVPFSRNSRPQTPPHLCGLNPV